MNDLRSDIAPLPIIDLAPIRLESSDAAEPFVLGTGASCLAGRCGLSLLALRRADGHGTGAFVDGVCADVRGVITPCGVVRTARIDGVAVTERLAVLGRTAVMQWTVDADADLVLPGGHRHRLAAAETVTRASDAMPRQDIAATFHASAAAVARAVRGGLALETTDSTGAALAWAKARLWFALSDAASVPGPAGTLAALALGQCHFVRDQLACAPSDLLPLLAARYAAATGNVHDLDALRPRLRAATDTAGGTAPVDDMTAAVRLAGLAELERTATDLGDARFAAGLRALARRMRHVLTGRTLAPPAGAVLAALRADSTQTWLTQWKDSDDVAHHAWHTWAAFEQGALATATRAWRRLTAEPDIPVRGAWPSRFGGPDDNFQSAALFVLTLAHGLLGIEPDAPRHRIRIAPRLSGTTSFIVRGIRCGDATVSLRVDCDAGELALRVAQDAGAIPLTAVLEPVTEAPVGNAWVDGRRAELDVRSCGAGIAVPVQLVLDDERTLCIARPARP
jgi:hypothetical protein